MTIGKQTPRFCVCHFSNVNPAERLAVIQAINDYPNKDHINYMNKGHLKNKTDSTKSNKKPKTKKSAKVTTPKKPSSKTSTPQSTVDTESETLKKEVAAFVDEAFRHFDESKQYVERPLAVFQPSSPNNRNEVDENNSKKIKASTPTPPSMLTDWKQEERRKLMMELWGPTNEKDGTV